ncbi:hypothetical protein B0H16DRAFT_1718986 [Mycena metata]|uniref:F-box domain-containing protein n=1 Tax=Mycena metata TaxID=1033252 RepID=A0AAD7NIH7_9AGAR|nr:hypothetical protein B0H16DRAFT_1718986 [Mycena metata]
MHRALQIPEVVELICSVAEFSTLAALAQTFRAFQPPALAVLWEKQTNLMRLLKCMPSDAWELKITPILLVAESTKVKFLRPITPSDWTRVLFYANYVKSFVQEGVDPVTWEVYATLSLSLPTYPLFPNVRCITWDTQDEVFPYFRMLVGNKLRSIVIGMHGSEAVRSSLLSSLTTFHPKLTHLEFNPTLFDSPMITQAIYSAICRLNHLESLKFSSLDLPSLLHLARLPNLRTLHLHKLPHDSATVSDFRTRIENTGPVFGSLREFTSYSESVKHITWFLDAIDPDALDKVDLEIESPILSEDWHNLNTSLAQTSSKTLTKIALMEMFSFDHVVPDHFELMFPTECMQPLLSCTNLTEVAVLPGHGIHLDDAFLKLMALAWPQLQKLDLSPRCQSAHYVPQVTLAGLIPLAQHCRDLVSLALVMNATVTDPHSKEKPGGGITNTALTDLEVVESPLSSPGAVASFLSAIFPNLRRVATRDEMTRNMLIPDWEDNMLAWEAVSDLVQVIASARAQEHRVSA